MKLSEQDHVAISVVIVILLLFLAFMVGSYMTAKRFYDCSAYTQEDFSREIAPLGCYQDHYQPDYRKIYQGVYIA